MDKALTFDDISIRPKYSEVASRSLCNLKTKITKNWYLDIPIIATPMDSICESEMAIEMYRLGGIGFVHRFLSIENQVQEIKKIRWGMTQVDYPNGVVGIATTCPPPKRHNFPIGAAIGIKEEDKERASKLVDAGVDILMIDVAHAHHVNVKHMMKWLKENLPETDIFVGTIATAEATVDLLNWGADGIHIGIGGGSLCETRIRAGVGIPMVSSLMECINVRDRLVKYQDIPLSSNGGITKPADASKAIGLGAETVIIGSLLSGTTETPGSFNREGQYPYEQLFKEYRGSASISSKVARGEHTNIEGNSIRVLFKGDADRIIEGLTDGIKSSMSYVGTDNIMDFQVRCDFVEVTSAGQVEAKPHLMG